MQQRKCPSLGDIEHVPPFWVKARGEHDHVCAARIHRVREFMGKLPIFHCLRHHGFARLLPAQPRLSVRRSSSP